MAKKSKTRSAGRTVTKKRAVKKAAARVAATTPTLLGVVRGAIAHKVARPILGKLSPDDLDILAKHMTAGTLMPGLTPIGDTTSKEAAINAMPADIGNVVSKLSEDDVENLRSHLRRLDRDDKTNAYVCAC